jgi:hypothetical protein
MINHEWEKKILRATPKNVEQTNDNTGVIAMMGDAHTNNSGLQPKIVKEDEKLMHYLQGDNVSGHATNMDMLASSINIMQFMREALLNASFVDDEDNNCYTIYFPFGAKQVTFLLSKVAVDNE